MNIKEILYEVAASLYNVFVNFMNVPVFGELFPDKHCLYYGKVSIFNCLSDTAKQLFPGVYLDPQEYRLNAYLSAVSRFSQVTCC